jgi:hypothetical protein
MAKTIVLRILEHDVVAVADLLDERAPATCALIWDRLPVEGRLVHGMYSGPELFIVLPGFPGVVGENQTTRPLPGDIGYWHMDGGRYATQQNDVTELVFIYDRGVEVKGPDGQATWVNLFAQMRRDESAEFLAVAKRARTEGPWTLRVERGDDG